MSKPPARAFKMKGIQLLEEKCNITQIVLKNVSPEAAGQYSCEVSADQPSFSTGMKSFNLQVIDLPQTDPRINGLKSRYILGENININCTSYGSHPAVNLTWYVNGIPINSTKVNFENRLTYSEFKFNLSRSHLINGKMKIRCSASMFDDYHKSAEKSVEIRKEKNSKFKYDVETTNTVDPRFQWELAETAQRSLDSSLIYATNGLTKKIKLNFDLKFVFFLLIFFILY